MGTLALLLDFRKAFDLVDSGIILRKLAKLNVNKRFWLCLRSFLEDKTQQVRLEGTLSLRMSCPSGVPRGSIVSPALFNVHINDFEDSIRASLAVHMCKYADDCTLDEAVQLRFMSHMQEVLDTMNNYRDRNKMFLNHKKTKDMRICFRDRIP